jgi:hypothetical protein
MPLWLRKPASEVISGELLTEIEEREAGMGHELDAAEMGAFLKEKPDPLRQAMGFYPPVNGLSPILVTVDMRSLELLARFAVPQVLLWLALVAFLPSVRATHPGWQLLDALRPLAITTAWTLFLLVAGNVLCCTLYNGSQSKSGTTYGHKIVTLLSPAYQPQIPAE